MIYYSSDQHFFHKSIITLCKRPFTDGNDADGKPILNIDRMNETLVSNWNETVSPTDTIYCLGDFAYRNKKDGTLLPLFNRLNGKKHLIIGNHDGHDVLSLPWASVQNYLEIKDSGFDVVLFHYAIRSWNGLYRNALHLFGHSHGKLSGNSKSLDVGVDAWDYRPVNLSTIMARMNTLPEVRYEEKEFSAKA